MILLDFHCKFIAHLLTGGQSLLYSDVRDMSKIRIHRDRETERERRRTMSCRIHMGSFRPVGGRRLEARGQRLEAGGQRLAGERGMDGWTDRCAEISPCVLQDIIPFVAH